MTGDPTCRYCETRHDPRWLCDPARQILAAMHEKADSYNMPSVDFDDPIAGTAGDTLGLGQPGDALIAQLVVKSLVAEVAGVWRPALVFTGQTPDGTVLPQWLLAGDDTDLRRATNLVVERGEAAIAAAARARGLA